MSTALNILSLIFIDLSKVDIILLISQLGKWTYKGLRDLE